jgi:hypothetical protein
MLPALAVLVLGGTLSLGLAYDLGRWASTWREAAFAADAGAEAGATALDQGAAYGDMLQLDPAVAEVIALQTAQTARPRAGRSVVSSADLTRVCVIVVQPFRPTLLRTLGIGELSVQAEACAAPSQG